MSFRRILLLSIGMSLISLTYFAFLRNGFNDSLGLYSNLSDSFSVIGVIVFLPSLAAYFDAFKVFYGFKYAMRTIFSNNFKERYKKFADYLEDQDTEIRSSVIEEFLLVSFIWIVIAILIAIIPGVL